MMETEEGIQVFQESWLKFSTLITVSDGDGIQEGLHSDSFKTCHIEPTK